MRYYVHDQPQTPSIPEHDLENILSNTNKVMTNAHPQYPSTPNQTLNETPLVRVKRHWFADFIADVTGLATNEDVEKIDDNEKKLQMEEERAQKEIELVLTKTNDIISSLTDQANKMLMIQIANFVYETYIYSAFTLDMYRYMYQNMPMRGCLRLIGRRKKYSLTCALFKKLSVYKDHVRAQ